MCGYCFKALKQVILLPGNNDDTFFSLNGHIFPDFIRYLNLRDVLLESMIYRYSRLISNHFHE